MDDIAPHSGTPSEEEVLSPAEASAVEDQNEEISGSDSKPVPAEVKASSLLQRSTTRQTGPIATKFSGNATRPTTSSAARMAAGTTLNKPPARPPSTASLRKHPSFTTGTGLTGTSISSGDERPPSAAEIRKKKIGLSGQAKRSSTSGVTGSIRSSVFKNGSRSPDRRPLISSSAAKAASSSADPRSIVPSSPAAAQSKSLGRVTPLTPTKGVRKSATPSPRSVVTPNTPGVPRPSSSLRNVGTPDGKKRLSTIPASPTVKSEQSPAQMVRKVDQRAVSEPPRTNAPVRPSLGKRKSTRSLMLQQRIREFEIVNEMLQAAVAAEDAGIGDETDHMQSEVAGTMAKLKSDLEEIRNFEKIYGRSPTETELSSRTRLEDDSTTLAETASVSKDSEDEVTELRSQLEERQAIINELSTQLEELRAKMINLSKAAEMEGVNIQIAAENIRAEHAARVDSLMAAHAKETAYLHKKLEGMASTQEARVEELLRDLESAKTTMAEASESKAREALEQQKLKHSETLEELKRILDQERKAASESSDKMHALENQIAKHQSDLEAASAESNLHASVIEAHRTEIEKKERELRSQGGVIKILKDELSTLESSNCDAIEILKESHSTAISNLHSEKLALQSKLSDLSDHVNQIDRLRQEDLLDKENEVSSLESVIEKLQNEIQNMYESKSDEHDMQILQLRQEHDQIIASLKHDHQDAIDGLSYVHGKVLEKLAKEALTTRNAHEQQLQSLRNERVAVKEELEKVKAVIDASKKESGELLEKLRESHSVEVQELSAKLQRMQQTVIECQAALEQSAQTAQESTAKISEAFEEKIQVLEDQCSKDGSALRDALEDHQASQNQIQELKQVLESLEKQSLLKDEYNANVLRRANAHAEAAAKSLAEQCSALESAKAEHAKSLDNMKFVNAGELERLKGELTRKHEAALTDLQGQYHELVAYKADLDVNYAKEVEAIREQHHAALSDSSKMIADLQEQHFVEINETKELAAAELVKVLTEAEERYEKKAEEISEKHQIALEGLQSTHEKGLLDLRSNLEQSFAYASAAAKQEHATTIAALNAEISKQKSELERALAEAQNAPSPSQVAELDSLKAQMAKLKEEMDSAEIKAAQSMSQIEDLMSKVKQDQRTIVKLTNTAQDADKLMAETNKEIDSLRSAQTEMAKAQDALNRSHATELTELQQQVKSHFTAKSESEVALRAATERVRNAEEALEKAELATRELDTLRDQLRVQAEIKAGQDAALKEVTKRAKASEAALAKVQSSSRELSLLTSQLNGALQEAETQRTLNETLMKEMQELKDLQEKIASENMEEASAAKIVQMEKSLAVAEKENAKLRNQLQTAEGVVDRSKTKIRELEASLKVTTAELTEAKTKRENGVDYLSPTKSTMTSNLESPTNIGKNSTGKSRRTPAKHSKKHNKTSSTGSPSGVPAPAKQKVSGLKEGEEVGSSIEGTMASIQEQLRQLDQVNEEFLEDHIRMAQTLATVAPASPHPNSSPPSTAV